MPWRFQTLRHNYFDLARVQFIKRRRWPLRRLSQQFGARGRAVCEVKYPTRREIPQKPTKCRTATGASVEETIAGCMELLALFGELQCVHVCCCCGYAGQQSWCIPLGGKSLAIDCMVQ